MKIQVARGLLRLWLVMTLLWVIAGSICLFAAYEDVKLKQFAPGVLSFDDLIPGYAHCWDFRVDGTGSAWTLRNSPRTPW